MVYPGECSLGTWQECVFWCCLKYRFVAFFEYPSSLVIFFLHFFPILKVLFEVSSYCHQIVFSFYSVSFHFVYLMFICLNFYIFMMDWPYHFKTPFFFSQNIFLSNNVQHLKSSFFDIKIATLLYITLCMLYIFPSFYFHSIYFFESKCFSWR